MLFRKQTEVKRPLFRRIINYFLAVGIALIIIFLIALGYTQTSTFRSWLKNFIVEEVNSSTNGMLSIESIDGTVLTSLILNHASYVFGEDTVFSAGRIELKVSPLRILLKTIYLRKLEIENANILLLKDETGELNISGIFPPSEEEEVVDTVTSSEPSDWKIKISNLELKNINFRHQSLENKNSNTVYPQPEMDDFRLENLNLSLSASADPANDQYELYISKFSAKPNLEGFRLINLSGNFVLLNDIAGITDLKIVTERSSISLNAAISDFSPFSNESISLEKSLVKLELNATDFDFDDLTNFISGTDLLKGKVETHLKAAGTFNDLELKNLEIKFNETYLSTSGYLQNLLEGADMIISVNFRNSYVNQDDVNGLLYSIDIPVYKDLGLLQFDSLYFSGKPLDFIAGLVMRTEKGKITAAAKMNLTGDEILYDYQITTGNLNLMPVAGINSNLNLTGNLKGKGFSPETLETSIRLKAFGSTIGEIYFDGLSIDADGSEGIINTDVSFTSLQTQGRLITGFNFTDSINTRYNFDITLAGFNITDFIKESDISSELNITLKGDGENFDQDRMNLFAFIEIDSSRINEINIDSTTLIVDLRSGEENRVINIISDLADLTVTGTFTLPEFMDLVVEEAGAISSSIAAKIEQIKPPDFKDKENVKKNPDTGSGRTALIPPRNLNIQYLLELKSFELLSLFLGEAEIEIDGELTGKLFAANDSILVTLGTKINQMKYWDGTELFYLSDFNLSLLLTNKTSAYSFEEFTSDLKITAGRIFTGREITNINFDLSILHNKALLELNAVYDGSLAVDLDGSLLINDDFVDVDLNRLLMKFREFELRNSGDVKFTYSDDNFNFSAFKMVHNGGELDLIGRLSLTGSEDVVLKLRDFSLKELSAGLLGLSPEKSFEGNLNLDFLMTGTANDPVIDLSYLINNVKVQNFLLGSVESKIAYADKLIDLNIFFSGSENLSSKRSLGFSGTIPADLSFFTKERFPQGQTLDITFFADNFDLRFASTLIPGLKNFGGLLNGSVRFSGEYTDLRNDGELTISGSSFVLEAVNLKYLLDAKIKFENNKILVQDVRLRNEPNIRDGGTITAYGEFVHRNFKMERIVLRASGDLKLLDERSKAANPALYGDIAVKTNREIYFTSSENRSYLNADLMLKRSSATITYSPTQTAFANENDKFTYVFISPRQQDLMSREIDSLITIVEAQREFIAANSRIPFDVDLRIEVETEAKVVFVISREFKQNLTAYLNGAIEYTVINEVPFVRGELVLLDGSKLDFIKTFKAEGNIRFFNEIDNPYINVTATYESFYSPDTLRTGSNEWDVQIRIRLEGLAKNITANFLQDESTIEVYKSRRNANQFELDAGKTTSDAMFFIIVNKFPEDASLQESNFAAATAASLGGSIVGTFLNEKLGDIVRSVNIQQVGTETKISLIGKVADFRYEIGGTSQVFQDLSRANVRIEHPFIFPNLILRLDRREPPSQSSTYSEMINELGLKYSFIF
jgi:hypothetical protein